MVETPKVTEGTVLWKPSEQAVARCRMGRYLEWLRAERGLAFDDYAALWDWSVADVGAFWQSIWDHFEIIAHDPPTAPMGRREMPGTEWFPGATLNYAEHALRRRDDHPAVIARDDTGAEGRLTRAELADQVARCREGLARLGVARGDRVAALLPNAMEALVGFLATASLGAVWSSCSPEFGVGSVLDRFQQIAPKVLLTVDGYAYGGKFFDRRDEVARIRAGLPSLTATVVVPRSDAASSVPDAVSWADLCGTPGELAFEAVPFDHPLWILYSSGTTGLPKAIVQGHGGILLEHYKALSLHCDLGADDRFFWFTTTGWMMWNFLVSGLLVGSTVVLFEGSPAFPDLTAMWKLAEDVELTYFGTSAPFLVSCRKEGIDPARDFDLSRLRGLGSTGAPLPAEGFAWVYDHVDPDLLLGSVSGGTDVCTAFVLSCPLLPVQAGEIQCRGLGCKVEAFDPEGKPVTGEVGELVITEPMPSMPIYFWGDEDGARMKASYFSDYEGVWRHGDWIKITARGTCVIYGRSDSTLNRGGVRMGTSEFYRVVETLPEVVESVVVDTGTLDNPGKLWLFLVLREGFSLDDALAAKVKATIREQLSPRHVPDVIHVVDDVPRTLSGKKLEVPIKRILNGTPVAQAASRDTLKNPEAFDAFVAIVTGGG